MSNVAIIPARGGSKRVINKNLREFKGLPLLAWSISAAKSSKLVDDVIVSSDCHNILAVAKECGAIAMKRPADLADDFSSAYEVARYVYLNQLDTKPDYVILLQPTSPLREIQLIESGIKAIEKDNSIDRVMEVNSLKLFSGKVVNNIWMSDYPEDKRSQDIEETYFPSGRLYVYRAKTTMDINESEGNTSIILGDYERNINIDYESDFKKLDFVYNNYKSDYEHLLNYYI
jgi:CMP-N,N'-diacetyllegionaminic acid synthase